MSSCWFTMFKTELHLTVLIYFYAFLVFLKYFLERSQLFSVAFSRKVGKSLKNTNTEDGSSALKPKKQESNKLYPRCFCVK